MRAITKHGHLSHSGIHKINYMKNVENISLDDETYLKYTEIRLESGALMHYIVRPPVL